MTEQTPVLPFDGFKWKWASVQPTESLNRPEYFVGVLRALALNEGRPKSDPRFNRDLRRIESEIGLSKGLTLARDAERNIIRNAGQYWKVLGVLKSDRLIALTPLGHLYASREINRQDFAVHTVVNFELPSSVFSQEEKLAWGAAGIVFRPLLLILQIVAALSDRPSQGYISESELARIVQPLSAITTDPHRIANAIIEHRSGLLNIDSWPNALTSKNDGRISAEFLIFLSNYNLLNELETSPKDNKEYELGSASPDDILELAKIDPAHLTGNTGIESSAADVSVRVQRRRVSREVYDRPGQGKFRADVLDMFRGRCLLTGTELPTVLQAAHIRPVSSEGSDLVGNGICLRSDVHTLFDANKIRIRPNGEMSYSREVLADPSYGSLPRRVTIPSHVHAVEVKWRWDFV